MPAIAAPDSVRVSGASALTSTPVSSTWLAFSALGAGIIHLALVVGSPLWLQIALVTLGLAEFAWGIAALACERLPAARIARVVAIAPMILWSLLVVGATLFGAGGLAAMLPLLPMAIATVFELAATWLLSRHLRGPRDTDAHASPAPPTDPAQPAPTPLGTGRYLLGVLAGAAIAGLLIAPALAATRAGASATSHGGHGITEPATVESPGDPLSKLNLDLHESH